MFDFIEHPLDKIALFIEFLVVETLDFAVGFRRDDHCRTHLLNLLDDRIGVIAFIGDERIGTEAIEQRQGLLAIGGLSAGEDETQRPAFAVNRYMDLGGKTALAATECLIELPPFAPAAC